MIICHNDKWSNKPDLIGLLIDNETVACEHFWDLENKIGCFHGHMSKKDKRNKREEHGTIPLFLSS